MKDALTARFFSEEKFPLSVTTLAIIEELTGSIFLEISLEPGRNAVGRNAIIPQMVPVVRHVGTIMLQVVRVARHVGCLVLTDGQSLLSGEKMNVIKIQDVNGGGTTCTQAMDNCSST